MRGGFGVLASNERKANEKGGVERLVGSSMDRVWTGRRFSDVLDINGQAAGWRDELANNEKRDPTPATAQPLRTG